MGGMASCFAKKNEGAESDIKSNKRRVELQSGMDADESLIQEAAALLLLRQPQNDRLDMTPVFDRSFSVKSPLIGKKKPQGLPRNSSSRARSLTAPAISLRELVNQERGLDGLETKKVVLVHGGGFGAWCWYKTMTLLEDAGFEVTAINLAGSGIHSVDTNNITSLPQYVNPLIIFLEKLGDTEKVILVGHDLGGTCISYAMEAFPAKIAKSVFLAAAMPKNGQRTIDVLSQEEATNDLMQHGQIFLYANGKDQIPTAISFETSSLKDLLFNQSPTKDLSLASVSMRPIPFAPVLEKLVLTEDNYGSVRRFYIETTEDNALPLSLQQSMCETNPPEKVFRLKGSDHSPFFSKPQALHKVLVEIAIIPPKQNLKTNHYPSM
ncbi:putative methylesterase 11, chloroplastic isoform X1 [Dendrobium catenatum]|uniref:putative methylesterase 11, chloroplastic isoform X1 n=1 Tax=Dendrobium catenatum TaxID=906689 RepID=UPI0009F26FF9|nr:putative methylesterase 11, chloroplastic isoform X1 [Dendrobium catenatum]